MRSFRPKAPGLSDLGRVESVWEGKQRNWQGVWIVVRGCRQRDIFEETGQREMEARRGREEETGRERGERNMEGKESYYTALRTARRENGKCQIGIRLRMGISGSSPGPEITFAYSLEQTWRP